MKKKIELKTMATQIFNHRKEEKCKNTHKSENNQNVSPSQNLIRKSNEWQEKYKKNKNLKCNIS